MVNGHQEQVQHERAHKRGVFDQINELMEASTHRMTSRQAGRTTSRQKEKEVTDQFGAGAARAANRLKEEQAISVVRKR
jgi:hypothetical protein